MRAGRGAKLLRVVRIGLIGLGTVGQAVVQLARSFAATTFQIERVVVRDHQKVRPDGLSVTSDPRDVLEDPAIDIVVEAAGGREPARQWILEALANGKSVVTANKEVMAYHGPELLAASRTHRSYLGYEAAIGGGIPIVDSLRYHFTSASVHQVYGVLNGTTNYLLCAMARGRSLQHALVEAQRLGFAEADPTADIQGLDTGRKLVLLIHLAFGIWTDPDRLTVQGLEEWPSSLLSRLDSEGLGLRLLAVARRGNDDRITAQVRPTVVPKASPLMGLQGAQNGVGIITAAGHFWMQGPGAGGLPTATSIWADIRRARDIDMTEAAPPDELRAEPDPVLMPVWSIAVDPDRKINDANRSDEGVIAFPRFDPPA